MKGFVPPAGLALSNEPLPISRSITIAEGISVKDLAEKLDVRAKDLIARLMMKGVLATVNQTLDAELAKDLAPPLRAEVEVGRAPPRTPLTPEYRIPSSPSKKKTTQH